MRNDACKIVLKSRCRFLFLSLADLSSSNNNPILINFVGQWVNGVSSNAIKHFDIYLKQIQIHFTEEFPSHLVVSRIHFSDDDIFWIFLFDFCETRIGNRGVRFTLLEPSFLLKTTSFLFSSHFLFYLSRSHQLILGILHVQKIYLDWLNILNHK